MNAYIWWLQVYYSPYTEKNWWDTHVCFLVCYDMYLGHTMPYSPSIHFHFGIPTTGLTKHVAEVRRTVGPVLEAQRLQGDSDRTLRWLGRFMRESKPWTYSKIKKISVVRQFWANGVETLLMASYGPRKKTCKFHQVSGCQERFGPLLQLTIRYNKQPWTLHRFILSYLNGQGAASRAQNRSKVLAGPMCEVVLMNPHDHLSAQTGQKGSVIPALSSDTFTFDSQIISNISLSLNSISPEEKAIQKFAFGLMSQQIACTVKQLLW